MDEISAQPLHDHDGPDGCLCHIHLLPEEVVPDSKLPPVTDGTSALGNGPLADALAQAFSLTWLPEVLRSAGLRVAEQPGWQTRGHGDVHSIKGVMCHHTAGPPTGIMPSLGLVTNGRPDLSGPLSQLCLGRDGTFFVVAAGQAYHAGAGIWQGLTDGNGDFIGIEAENTGVDTDPWPEVQLDAYRRGVAAILNKIGANQIMAAGHKEFAPKRKIDPTFDMDAFRHEVARLMSGDAVFVAGSKSSTTLA